MTQMSVQRVLLVAAENDALHGAKVGGMADVIRDLPPALAQCDVIADVAMPNYGFLAQEYCATPMADIEVDFEGRRLTVSLFRLPRPQHKDDKALGEQEDLDDSVAQIYLFDHPLFNHQGQVYCNGSTDRPFAEDATKFALFSLCVATALVRGILPRIDVLHLHDWHTGMVAMLRSCVADFSSLKALPCVFTIHNLALQGIRPFYGNDSSFAHWFPQYVDKLNALADVSIFDPRYANCINPMRMGIVLSDKVHLVSPTYAREVLIPSDHEKGFFGGEGLEGDLAAKVKQNNLIGIINGCVYNSGVSECIAGRASHAELLIQAENTIIKWQAKTPHVSALDSIAIARIGQYKHVLLNDVITPEDRQVECESERFLLTYVGRLTEQKMLILLQPFNDPQGQFSAKTVLEAILESLKRLKPGGVFMLLGSGDPHIAKVLQAIAVRYSNFVFLHGYDDVLAEELYKCGSLFLMPSSFEPCGISQMLAMRVGQPCLVHAVGGLNDTVEDNVSGWMFNGNTLAIQSQALVDRFNQVVQLYGSETWLKVKQNAAKQRFTWDEVAKQYIEKLYYSHK